MDNENKKVKEFFPQEYFDILEAIDHASKIFDLPVKYTTSAIGVECYYSGKKIIACTSPGNKKVNFSLYLTQDVLNQIKKLGVSLSSLEEIGDDYYKVPKEIYQNKDLFAKIFRLVFDSA